MTSVRWVRLIAMGAIGSLGFASLGFGVSGCSAPADASVLLDLKAFSDNNLPGLRAPRALLDVLDEDGEHLAVEVRTSDDETELVQSPLPVPCDEAGACAVQVRLRPARATFVLHVSAADRCGTRAELVALSSAPVELSPWQSAVVQLDTVRFDFDGDDDGLVNALESATCGRFDAPDGSVPPQACLDEGDPCCADVSALEGHEVAFVGGAHTDRSGAVVTVAPFALDATEVTWRQLARCVAAGGCLQDAPAHPARADLDARALSSEPVVGLTPAQAQELCAFFGKRLPFDEEWDFAAAHRDDPDIRGRYPWDDDNATVSCSPDGAGLAANFSVPGVSCPGAPLPVGSYPSSDVTRGAGGPVADLGGNVAEWTLVPGDSAPPILEVPPGHDAVVLRGGGAQSPLALLENDLPAVARFPTSADVEAWRATVQRLSAAAGFRCATSVDDGTVAPAFAAEPTCGGDE